MSSESAVKMIDDLGSEHPLARYRAVDALSARREEVFDAIVDLLVRGNAYQRAGAAEILGRWHDARTFDHLVGGLKD